MKLTASTLGFSLLLCSQTMHGHGLGPTGLQPLEWHTSQIRGVISGGGYSSFPGRTRHISGKDCLIGSKFSFDVSDGYAYDIDETVEVEIEFDLRSAAREIILRYDKSDGALQTPMTSLPAERTGWHRKTFVLERARFAGMPLEDRSSERPFTNFLRADFFVGTLPSKDAPGAYPEVTICEVTLKRSHTTPKTKTYGGLFLTTVDQSGRGVPARVGIYDESGRFPVPSSEAVAIKEYDDPARVVVLQTDRIVWPSKNRYAFYVDGRYHTKLPPGRYRLIVAKGLEYRILDRYFEIAANQETRVTAMLGRWIDMPALGWYSGDAHVHHKRISPDDNQRFRLHSEAEDLHVANLLQMGTVSTFYYDQYNWGRAAIYGDPPYILVPGQEDPRTDLGHTSHLNLTAPVRDPSEYFLYYKTFEKTRSQGATVGYAHGGGLSAALDVPFGLVDFFEVLQRGALRTEMLFDFLNLGFKLSPAAGTDYPYLDQPGSVRSYARSDAASLSKTWFEGLKAGKTFATNGPMLQFTVNGLDFGAHLNLRKGEKLKIKAGASINPDVDFLDSLELVEQGETVARSSSRGGALTLDLTHEVSAEHGTWFMVRASGKTQRRDGGIFALSAPIYVSVDGRGFCKKSAVRRAAESMKDQLKSMAAMNISNEVQFEIWDAAPEKYWPAQQALLQPRIERATAIYDDLIRRAEAGMCNGDR